MIAIRLFSQGAISSGIGAAVGYGVGKVVEIQLGKKYPDLIWAKYNPQPLNDKVPHIQVYRRNIIPDIYRSLTGEFGNRLGQYQYNYYMGKNNEN